MIIVALSLIALFGMLVLVVDVGGLLLRRRALVNGSDAAALAAAKSCVLSILQDSRTAEQASDEWASLNDDAVVTGGTNILQISGCDTSSTGYVSVRYSATQSLFFAPVLGVQGDGNVTTDATAIWGPPGAANPIPIVVYAQSFNNCRLDQDPTPGAECYIWEDNNNTSGAQSSFGLLDLRTDDPSRYGWDSDPGVVCSSAGNGPKDWIENYPDPDVGDLSINYPEPTFVCRGSGMQESAWDALDDLIDDDDSVDQDDIEDILYFPINRCYDSPTGSESDGQIDSGTDPVACGSTPHQYDIIGFVAVKLKHVYRPGDVMPSTTTCGPSARAFPASAPLSLDGFGVTEGCFTQAPAEILTSSVLVRRVGGGPAAQRGVRGPDGATCVGSNTFDYCFDPVTRTIRWNNAGPAVEGQNFNVSFDWSELGPCGTPPGNNAGHCLVVEVTDVQVGGSRPGEGNPDSNLRAFRLCEPTVSSTCDPISVPVP